MSTTMHLHTQKSSTVLRTAPPAHVLVLCRLVGEVTECGGRMPLRVRYKPPDVIRVLFVLACNEWLDAVPYTLHLVAW